MRSRVLYWRYQPRPRAKTEWKRLGLVRQSRLVRERGGGGGDCWRGGDSTLR